MDKREFAKRLLDVLGLSSANVASIKIEIDGNGMPTATVRCLILGEQQEQVVDILQEAKHGTTTHSR